MAKPGAERPVFHVRLSKRIAHSRLKWGAECSAPSRGTVDTDLQLPTPARSGYSEAKAPSMWAAGTSVATSISVAQESSARRFSGA